MILAVIAGYGTSAILVAGTEQFLPIASHAMASIHYFVLDVISQCLYTVIGGYVCCVIAQSLRRLAMWGLIGLGVLAGTVSLIASWQTEPHWYGIAFTRRLSALRVDRMEA
jgi:hypothetical protein